MDVSSAGVVPLRNVPDVIGLVGRREGAVENRVLQGRDARSVRVLVPDCRGLDQNFHDVTIVDMGDLPESHVSLPELSTLIHKWPPAVINHTGGRPILPARACCVRRDLPMLWVPRLDRPDARSGAGGQSGSWSRLYRTFSSSQCRTRWLQRGQWCSIVAPRCCQCRWILVVWTCRRFGLRQCPPRLGSFLPNVSSCSGGGGGDLLSLICPELGVTPLVYPGTGVEDERPTPAASPPVTVDHGVAPLSAPADVDVELGRVFQDVGTLPEMVTPVSDPEGGGGLF